MSPNTTPSAANPRAAMPPGCLALRSCIVRTEESWCGDCDGPCCKASPPQQSPLWTSPGVSWSWPILDADRPLGPAHYDIHLSSTSNCTPSVEEIFTPPPL